MSPTRVFSISVATLGIVEFVFFLIQKYYDRLDKAQKKVFADVHFMLFYCALFNAIGSAILAIKVFLVVERIWVRTELLDLDHYIEIREEFERVDAILYGENHDATEFVLEYNILGVMLGLRAFWQRAYRFVRYPILSKRRSELLVQVRFHDLRVHFLKANNLPLQLQVSNYLKRSLVKKLKRLVHISAFAWLLLTGVVNLVYFLMGIVMYVTGDIGAVGLSMTWIFLSSMVFFVILSLMIYNKINWVFQRIMRMKLIDENANSNFKSGMKIRKGEREVKSQFDLFWGGNPNYITVAIQFSQFGFALALSILLVFWDDINVKRNPVPIYAYPVTVFACYGAFVLIMTQVIPRYTLCTSLGQLVNKKHLHETLAEYQLEEAQRRRQQLLDEQDDDFSETEACGNLSDLDSSVTAGLLDQRKTIGNPALLADVVPTDPQALRPSLRIEQSDHTQRLERTRRRKVASEGVASMRQTSGSQKVPQVSESESNIVRQKSTSSSASIQQMKDANHIEARPVSKSLSGSSLVLLADLVQTDTHSLRSALSVKYGTRSQQERRKLRGRAASSGVAAMRQMGDTPIPRARHVRQKSKSLSATIQQMKDAEHNVLQPMRDSSSGSSLTGSLEVFVSAAEGHVEDQPLADQAPASHLRPRRLTPPFPKESSTTLPQLDNASDSDDHSDISDIPDVDIDDAKANASESEKHGTIYDAVHDYFLGPKYPVVSAVFGTLGVFFVIGQRIEGLLLATGALANLMNTFHFLPVVTFWWETAYLCCFIGASSFISVIFRPGRASTNRTRALFLASVLDVVLSGSCLALLMIAEAQRCYCAEGDGETIDCCAFGSRSSGGVGNIEPITSIIMLRLFRFAFSKKVVEFLGKWIAWPNTGVTHEKHHNGHHGRHSADPNDALVGMWQAAVSMYPDVVEEHGEFSSELLQAMLGIGIVENSSKRAVSATHQEESVTENVDVSSEDESVKDSQNALRSYVPKHLSDRQQATGTTADERRNPLSPEAQTVNIGGQENRSVSSPVLVPKTPLKYELGPPEAKMDEEQFSFISPRAKLVRSMRRCDRKLLPLIDRWTVVDLVVTKHEIVFFDAGDFDEPCSKKYSPEALRAMEISRQALIATKGGKGLRLRDVAAGRKVVGRLAVSAIDSVHVERRLPHEVDADRLDAVEYMEQLGEFWESNKKTLDHLAKDDPRLCREARWARLKEDHLLIHSDYGTLCFRFFSDLGDAEAHRDRCFSEREDSGSLIKNTALLWCQTVVRLCKRAQLKQKLDHYGDDNDEELRDYLRVVGPKQEVHHRVLSKLRVRPRHFRRTSSLRNMNTSDSVDAASIHPGDTSFRSKDCELVDVL
jgi:hypothetical protein